MNNCECEFRGAFCVQSRIVVVRVTDSSFGELKNKNLSEIPRCLGILQLCCPRPRRRVQPGTVVGPHRTASPLWRKARRVFLPLPPSPTAARGSPFHSQYLKASDTIANHQNKCQDNNFFGTEQCRAVDSIKHCEKRLHLK